MRDYGNHAVPFELAYDPEGIFTGTQEITRRKASLFNARYHTARRGVELGCSP